MLRKTLQQQRLKLRNLNLLRLHKKQVRVSPVMDKTRRRRKTPDCLSLQLNLISLLRSNRLMHSECRQLELKVWQHSSEQWQTQLIIMQSSMRMRQKLCVMVQLHIAMMQRCMKIRLQWHVMALMHMITGLMRKWAMLSLLWVVRNTMLVWRSLKQLRVSLAWARLVMKHQELMLSILMQWAVKWKLEIIVLRQMLLQNVSREMNMQLMMRQWQRWAISIELRLWTKEHAKSVSRLVMIRPMRQMQDVMLLRMISKHKCLVVVSLAIQLVQEKQLLQLRSQCREQRMRRTKLAELKRCKGHMRSKLICIGARRSVMLIQRTANNIRLNSHPRPLKQQEAMLKSLKVRVLIQQEWLRRLWLVQMVMQRELRPVLQLHLTISQELVYMLILQI